jgi:DNA invertase Pin-like site-specific DNA recombinase
MNELLYSPKIKPEHLARKAIVYLRQSSEKQVRQNLESQRLQYELGERIRSLGWQQIETINSDLGSSAAMGSASREGFERVLSSVALGEVGIVASREVSRLSRTDKDWCRLLEVCQIFGTLIGDEQQCLRLKLSGRSARSGYKRNTERRRTKSLATTTAGRTRVQGASRRTVQKASSRIRERWNRQDCIAFRSSSS